jgi:predicted secreted protein
MMKRLSVVLALLLTMPLALLAGDLATLVNLGFSPDSAYFMFGFYGYDGSTSKPYAEIFIVDTARNNFVNGGTFKGLYAVTPEPGWHPAGAFYKVFSDASALARKYRIDHLAQGRLVYLLMDGQDGPDTLSFKDFKTGSQWDITLTETIEESRGTIMSSFGLGITVKDANGRSVSVKAGNPHIKRQGVTNYTIRGIVLAPNGKTVAMLIERAEKLSTGTGIRYMVETFRLP